MQTGENNRGEISIYLAAILLVCLALILVVLQGIRLYEGKAKARQAVVHAVASMKGDYQPDLFQRYHLLALDRTYYGRGEGYLEERMKEYLTYNLTESDTLYSFHTEDVLLTDTQPLTENGLEEMKRQIREYMELKLPAGLLENMTDTIRQADTEDQKADLSQDIDRLSVASGQEGGTEHTAGDPTREDLQALGLEEALKSQGVTDFETISMDDLLEMDLVDQGIFTDPRKALDGMLENGILTALIPEQESQISKESVPISGLPSSVVESAEETPAFSWDLQPYGQISDLQWEDILSEAQSSDLNDLQEVYGIAYALDAFRHWDHSSESEVGKEAHVWNCEVEYLVVGKASDYENLSEVAERIGRIRLIPNIGYALTDESMKEQTLMAATILLAPIGLAPAAKPVSYVLLVCWAYAESLMDVRSLLLGHEVPFVKDKESWQLSFNHIGDLASQDSVTDDEGDGLSYDDYLLILLASMPDQDLKYYRMLDIMQVNIQENIPEFRIENCVTQFEVQVNIQEQQQDWFFQEEGRYL